MQGKGAKSVSEEPEADPDLGYDKVALRELSDSWRDAPGITQTEIGEWLQRGGYLRSVIVESEASETHKTRYTLFVLTSWRKGYHIMHVNWPARPRLFKDFERLQALIRHEFGYQETIAVRLPNVSGTKKQKSYFRER